MNQKRWEVGRIVIHNTHMEILLDVSVDVHHIPSYTYDLFKMI